MSLTEIRKKIDSLDDQIHDLLMERADLIVGVTEEKKKNNIPVVQPAREAQMIRRLLARHRGPLPEATIIGIWRELVGAVSLLQTGLKVSVSPENFCWDQAKNYFGTVLPMVRATNTMMAIAALRENDSNFAVLPWPQDSGRRTNTMVAFPDQSEGRSHAHRYRAALRFRRQTVQYNSGSRPYRF
jgi:chorismate mutase / prephenate dehydratase